ncbi:CNH domain-containing protein [Trypanosoma grayi]|uniref:CNH domain-containing protein n=1 Tax=Trypanosoma grayi TaxID=71804 RepID=UPI0004F4B3FD|nr:CNH domain-containing protein [Trypanosoma grayi]KEG11260.1 CNH domain-containing protein [Trypanosoma grayi]
MSHEAFRLNELKQKLSYKIESIATAGNLFFLGTSDGKLVVYEVSLESYDAQCVHIQTSKHKQPIRMIVPIVEKEILIAVAGDIIVLHELQHMSHVQLNCLPENRLPELGTVKGTKDVVALHVKRHRGVYSMAVLQRKKVTIYEYKDQLQNFTVVKDALALPEGAKTLLWVGKNLMLGFRREYVLLDVSSGATDCLYPTGKSGVPLLLSLDPVPELLVGGDGTGIRALHDGSLVPGRSGMPWPSLPTSAAYVHPFLLTAHDSNCIEVRVPFLSTLQESTNPALCQSISVKYADRISQRPFVDFDARLPRPTTPPDALRKDITIAINSSNTVYLLEFVPLKEQVMALASAKCFEAGLLLCQLCVNEVDETTVVSLKTQFALWTFATKREFRTAMLRFRDANVDPRLVIDLFPGFLTQKGRETWGRPPKEYAVSLDTTDLARHMQDAVAAFLDYALPLRCEYTAGKEETVRVLAEAIDTAIVKAYVVMGQEQELIRFLGEDNVCDLAEGEVFLADSEQWVALVALWHRHKLHSKSLALLCTLGTTGQPAAAAADTAVMPTPSAEVKVPFDSEFSRLLETLLAECFAENERTNSSSDSEGGFTPQSVLAKLLAKNTVDVDSSQMPQLLRRCVGVVTTIQYVRRLSWDECETAALVERYARWILADVPPRWSAMMLPAKLVQPQHYPAVLRLVSADMSDIGHTRSDERLVEWLSRVFGDACSTCIDAATHNAYWYSLAQLVVNNSSTQQQQQQMVWQRCLDDFLRTSRYMDVAKAKVYFEQPDVRSRAYAERAIIYQRLRLHEDAIRMFLYEADHLQEAQDYATRVGRDEEDDAFEILLRLLLNPGDTGSAPLLQEAVAMVNTCDGVDPLTALPLLPDSTPVADIADFMKRSLRDASTRSCNAAIYASVLESCIRKAEVGLVAERSRRIVMDLGTCCAVCEKKMRLDTVFVRFPNGVVVHQACMDDEHVCPVTREDFRRGIESATRETL